MTISQVPVEVILPLRQQVLRPGKTLEESRFEGDTASDTFHLALIQNEDVLAIASFMQVNSPKFLAPQQYRLRGMAVAESQRGKQLGAQVFQKGIELLQSKHIDLLWFNARAHAVPFYQKQGCQISDEPFEIEGIGQHYRMFKSL